MVGPRVRRWFADWYLYAILALIVLSVIGIVLVGVLSKSTPPQPVVVTGPTSTSTVRVPTTATATRIVPGRTIARTATATSTAVVPIPVTTTAVMPGGVITVTRTVIRTRTVTRTVSPPSCLKIHLPPCVLQLGQ